MLGKCHLCHKVAVLRDSHIWPKFAYKRYVTIQGGLFADLSQGKLHGQQYTRYWFCDDCEGILSRDEDQAARLCARLLRNPLAEVSYNERLLRYAASISWRTMKLHYEQTHHRAIEFRWQAYTHWKRFLRGTRPGLAPYTQHVFLLGGMNSNYRGILGGGVIEDESLVVSQIGPLIIVGLLCPDRLPDEEKRIWKNSLVQREGGIVKPLTLWRTGRGNPEGHNLTLRFAQILAQQEALMMKQIRAMYSKDGELLPPRPKGKRAERAPAAGEAAGLVG